MEMFRSSKKFALALAFGDNLGLWICVLSRALGGVDFGGLDGDGGR